LRLGGSIFLNVNGVLQHLRVIHGAPTDQAPMIGEGWKLIFFNVAMNSLLNVEVFAHLFV